MPTSLNAQAYLCLPRGYAAAFSSGTSGRISGQNVSTICCLADRRNIYLLFRNGKSAISYEFCYFDVCDTFDAAQLTYYCNILEDMAARYVPWSERSHSYSMLSMVVLTDGEPDKDVLKQLKKYKHEEKRKRPEDGYGWCSNRLCIVDINTGICYTNRHGSALANRVKLTTQRVANQ